MRVDLSPPKYHYLDHDTDYLAKVPPVTNTWYTIFSADDVRLIWIVLSQANTEAADKNVEVRLIMDGVTYFLATAFAHNTFYYCFRTADPSVAGSGGLAASLTVLNAGYHMDKRAQSASMQMRLTSAAGTAQTLIARIVRETLEVT